MFAPSLEDSRAALKALSKSPPKRRFMLAKFSLQQTQFTSFGIHDCNWYFRCMDTSCEAIPSSAMTSPSEAIVSLAVSNRALSRGSLNRAASGSAELWSFCMDESTPEAAPQTIFCTLTNLSQISWLQNPGSPYPQVPHEVPGVSVPGSFPEGGIC